MRETNGRAAPIKLPWPIRARGREGPTPASALQPRPIGVIAQEPELPPVSTSEDCSAIRRANLSSSLELLSERLPALDRLADARELSDWIASGA